MSGWQKRSSPSLNGIERPAVFEERFQGRHSERRWCERPQAAFHARGAGLSFACCDIRQRVRPYAMTDKGLVHIIDDDEAVRAGLGTLIRSAGNEARLYDSPDAFMASDLPV